PLVWHPPPPPLFPYTTLFRSLYSAMDWLLEAQPKVEAKLAERHLSEGGLVLYDLTSVYLEGGKCELAKRGYSRDGKRGLPQIELDRKSTRLNSSHVASSYAVF